MFINKSAIILNLQALSLCNFTNITLGDELFLVIFMEKFWKRLFATNKQASKKIVIKIIKQKKIRQ